MTSGVPFGNCQYEVHLGGMAELDLTPALSNHTSQEALGPETLVRVS